MHGRVTTSVESGWNSDRYRVSGANTAAGELSDSAGWALINTNNPCRLLIASALRSNRWDHGRTSPRRFSGNVALACLKGRFICPAANPRPTSAPHSRASTPSATASGRPRLPFPRREGAAG